MPAYPLTELKSGLTIGSFVVLEVYPEGRGGMARVVRAQPKARQGGGTEMALKISRVGPNQNYFFSALQREVEILQRLDHAGVVRLAPVSQGKNPYKERAVEILGSPWFFGMEILRGGSLESYIADNGPLLLQEAASICYRVGRALDHVHEKGFAHNDVKPDNVLFRKPPAAGELFEPVLIDFGVAAKLVIQQLDGSIVYMAPERLQESREPSAPETVEKTDPTKGDVWSVGILLYRLLVGREPFLGVTDRSITSAIMRTMPPPMTRQRRDIPKELDDFVIEGCLAKDPRVRVTMRHLNGVLRRYAGDLRLHRTPKAKRVLPWQR